MEKANISVLKKLFSISLILIIMGMSAFNIMTTASSSTYPDSFSTSYTRQVVSTNWAYVYGPNNEPVVGSQVLVYIANGTTSDGMLPIFVTINGQVGVGNTNSPWYEDDGGVDDPNGPTMLVIFNISNNPSNTVIEIWNPSGTAFTNQIGHVQYSISTTVYCPDVPISVSSGITAQFYVYELTAESIQPAGSNLNYVKGWEWALNMGGANSNAQADYYWPSSVMFYTPPVSSNILWPSQNITMIASTQGNFWENAWPYETWHATVTWKVELEVIYQTVVVTSSG